MKKEVTKTKVNKSRFYYSECIISNKLNIADNNNKSIRNLEVEGCPLKETLFGQFTLLMNARYSNIFP